MMLRTFLHRKKATAKAVVEASDHADLEEERTGHSE